MNPPSAGGQPPSFKTNVNRAKTKRWVEAKSYSYDGDDWGDVDDYDEYGGYDEPPPPSRPTGLRQQGQSATQTGPGAYINRTDVYQSPVDNRQQGYHDMGRLPPAQPQYRDHGELHRSGSFRRGDESRTFSAGGVQQGTGAHDSGPLYQPQTPQAQSHATRFSQIEGINQSHPISSSPEDYPTGSRRYNQPVQAQSGSPRQPLQVQSHVSMDDQARNVEQSYSPGGNYRGVSYSDQPRHTSMGSRTQSMTSNVSSQDFHNRRDFTPSAVPPPLQTRGSPSPHSAGDSQSSIRHPPRQDSLSQQAPSNSLNLSQPTPLPAYTDPDDDVLYSRERAGSNTSKPLPFVRPADIYKRMQEEKEKERQSQESSRPSMDAIMGRETTPVSPHGDRLNTDSLARGPQRRDSFEISNDGESSQRLKPTLDPVKERKSEYGFEGFSVNDPAMGPQELPVTSAGDETSSTSLPGHHSTLKPMLPDVTRMSGFGESFLNTVSPEEPQSAETEDLITQVSTQSRNTLDPELPHTDLQHIPSVGFRSIVNQAFDTPDDQIPPTPSSTADSTVGRSASGGTSVVSPINISRESSAAAISSNAKEGDGRPVTPTLPQVQSGYDNSRPMSTDSLATPRQIVRKVSPSQNNKPGSNEARATPFMPGHRRDLSTPSPDNSPARTPALESTQNLRQPQEVELAMATPVETNFPTKPSSQSIDLASSSQLDLAASNGPRDVAIDPARQKSSVISPPNLPPDTSRRSRPESPGSNRVRDLAEKFESGNSSPHGSERSLNQRGNVSAATTQNDAMAEPRPVADRMESFRPRLPGGWDSFASNAPSMAPKRPEMLPKSELGEGSINSGTVGKSRASPISTQYTRGTEENGTSEPDSQINTNPEQSDPLSDPFAAVAAAGSALAGALAAAVGMENPESADLHTKGSSTPDLPQGALKDTQTRAQVSTATVNTESHPDASAPLPPMADEDRTLSLAPKPLSKDVPPTTPNENSETRDYIPPIVPLNPRPGSYINTDEVAAAHPRPPMPPSLSTDTGSQFESDRLRREIVKNLDPAQSSEPTTAESDSPWQDDSRLSADPSIIRRGHDSGVLPSEYDSYWNGSSSGSTSRTNSAHDHIGAAVAVKRHDGAALVGITPSLNVDSDHRAEPPKNTSPLNTVPERPIMPHRFSWEQFTDNVTATRAESLRENVVSYASTDLPPSLGHHNLENSVELPSGLQNQESIPNNSQGPSHPGGGSHASEGPSFATSARDILDKGHEGVINDSTGKFSGAPLIETNRPPGYPGSLEVAEPGSGQQLADSTFDHHPNEVEYSEPSISQQGVTQVPESPSQFTASQPVRDGNLPPLPPTADQPKLRAFREILALKSPLDRIHTFNETREQFAHLDTGLAHWLDVKVRELPEHAHLLSNHGQFATGTLGHKPSPSRTRLLGIRTTGSPSTQQPYYQQYLNASSQPTASNSNPTSSYHGSTLPQGSSPSGGGTVKLSSQQVQAKGKDLLHTAGIFGGKANVAAKGLFSKGRSKLKGSGGADKASTSAPSPDPIFQGMQPQNQPQPISTSSTPPRETSPDLGSRAIANPLGSQASQSSDTPYNSRALPQLPATPSPHDDVQSHRYDDRSRHLAENEDASGPPSYNKLSGPPKTLVDPELGNENSRPLQSNLLSRPVMIDNVLSKPLQGIDTRGSYNEASAGLSSPHYVDISNRTPTQADFRSSNQNYNVTDSNTADGNQSQHHEPEPSARPGSAGNATDLAADPKNGHMKSLAGSQSPYFPQDERTVDTSVIALPHRDALDGSRALKESEESDANIHYAASHAEPPVVQPSNQYSGLAPPDAQPRLEEQKYIDSPPILGRASSNVPPSVPPTDAGVSNQSAPRPFSFVHGTPNQSEQHSGQDSQRAPSIDSLPSQMHPDRPPSPVSPQPSEVQETPAHRGRAGPVHHGIDHDFLPDGSQTSTPKRRSRSFSRLFKNSDQSPVPSEEQATSERRSRSISLLFKNPELTDHPTYTRDALPAGGTDMPMHYYPEQISREDASIPRQQATEYQLEGVGPPAAQLVDTGSRSRKNSKGSSFFKTSNSPVNEAAVTQSRTERQFVASPIQPPIASQRKPKRASLFRSLTRQRSHDRDQGRENSSSSVSTSRGERSQRSGSGTSRDNDTSAPSKSESNTSRNKLQRASTSGFQKQEQDGGKKKRFSAMGSLFGRSDEVRRQSTFQSSQPRTPSQQPPTADQAQSHASYNQSPAPTTQPHEFYSPRQDYVEPPLGGYYAPGRVDSREPEAFVTRESPDAHRPPQLTRLVQPTPPPARTPEPPAYVQDATIRQHITPPSQGNPALKSRTSSWMPQRSSNTSDPNATGTSIFNRSKSRDKPSGRRSKEPPSPSPSASAQAQPLPHPHNRSSNQNLPPLPPPENPAFYHPPPNPSTLPTHPHHPYPHRLETPSRAGDSPPPPPLPPKDDWHQSQPRYASLHSRSPSGISALTSHTRSPSQFTQQPPPPQPSHSRSPSHLSEPRAPSPRRLSAEIRMSLPPLQTNMTPTPPAQNISAKNTSAESRKKRQRELEMEGSIAGAGAGVKAVDDGEERVLMSPTSYPGQGWTPGGWEQY